MKKVVFAIGILLIVFSCQKSPENKLIGTWKVVDVETDFDESRMSVQSLKQLVDMQKQTYFRILNDTIMVIISAGNTYETKWVLDHETQEITYFFDNGDAFSIPNDLGRYENDQIVSQSKMSMGDMVVYFEKE